MTRKDDLPQPPGIAPDDSTELTLSEVCRACEVQTEFIVGLVEEGVLAPAGREPPSWRFTYVHLRRVRVASRLHRDLGLNVAGAALALELLEEIEALRARLQVLGGNRTGGGARRSRAQG
jgi:chaperone modulatory protein CbpM